MIDFRLVGVFRRCLGLCYDFYGGNCGVSGLLYVVFVVDLVLYC